MRKIRTFGDKLLQKVSREVNPAEISELQPLIDEMFDIMYDQNGVGLAAVQIGVPIRLFVLDCGFSGQEVYINPKIVCSSADVEPMQEGCLSFPGFFAPVARHPSVIVEALNRAGEPFTLDSENAPGSEHERRLRCQAIQHEYDHLDGVTMDAYLSVDDFKRLFNRK